jgi:hypothetical protein
MVILKKMKNKYTLFVKVCLIFLLIIQTFVNGQNAPFANFDAGTGSYIDYGKGVNLNCINELPLQNTMTITMWVKWNSKANSGVGNWANLLTLADSSGSGDNGVFWIQHNSDNTKFEFALHTTARTYIQSSVNPQENVWYHLAVVYDGNLPGSNMKIYVNGVEDVASNKSGNIRAFPGASKLNLGRWSNPGNNHRRFNGSIDEVSFWNIALSLAEIQTIMINSEGITGSAYDALGLIGYWDFDDFTANDLSSCGNDGVLGNSTTLPVEMLSFDLVRDGKNVLVKWVTASELNNDFFTLEKSKDGLFYEKIIEIKGAGNSNHPVCYQAIDYEPNNGINYYRLKQTDFDGTIQIVSLRSISFASALPVFLSVGPNPVKAGQVVTVSLAENETMHRVTLFDMSGRVLISEMSDDLQYLIETESLTPGLYFICSENDGSGFRQKLIVL